MPSRTTSERTMSTTAIVITIEIVFVSASSTANASRQSPASTTEVYRLSLSSATTPLAKSPSPRDLARIANSCSSDMTCHQTPSDERVNDEIPTHRCSPPIRLPHDLQDLCNSISAPEIPGAEKLAGVYVLEQGVAVLFELFDPALDDVTDAHDSGQGAVA